MGRPTTPSVKVIYKEEISSVTYSLLKKHWKKAAGLPIDSSISMSGSSNVQSASTGVGRMEEQNTISLSWKYSLISIFINSEFSQLYPI